MNSGMKLSVVIPVFNERRTIRELLARVEAVAIEKEIVVVDDGSTDGTRMFLDTLRGRPGYVIVFQPANRGKGAALHEGFRHVTGDLVVVQDADLEYDPQDWLIMLPPLLDGRADVVYGSRFAGYPRRVLHFWHEVANRALTTTSNMLTNINLTDMETCYKMFRREVIQPMPLASCRFGFEPEVTVKVARGGWRIYEVPISYAGRTYADGKKIGLKDAFEALWVLLRYSLFDRTPVPMRDEREAVVPSRTTTTTLPAWPEEGPA